MQAQTHSKPAFHLLFRIARAVFEKLHEFNDFWTNIDRQSSQVHRLIKITFYDIKEEFKKNWSLSQESSKRKLLIGKLNHLSPFALTLKVRRAVRFLRSMFANDIILIDSLKSPVSRPNHDLRQHLKLLKNLNQTWQVRVTEYAIRPLPYNIKTRLYERQCST